MRYIIVLSMMASLFNDFFVRNIPALSKATSIFTLLIILFFVLNITKNNKMKKYTNIYILIYINIFYFLVQIIFTGFNSYSIKMILYSITIIALINLLDDKGISLLYKIVIILSVILSIDIIIHGFLLIIQGINLRNLRHFTILDKQGYNMFYSIALPVLIIRANSERKIKYILILIFDIVAVLFFIQIKSFLYTIPIGVICSLIIFKRINIKSITKFMLILILAIVPIITLFPQIIPKQISTVINYYVFKETYNLDVNDLKDLDTFVIRAEVWNTSFDHLKESPVLGIGYGNYFEIAKDKKITSDITGIVYDMPTVTESGLLTFIVEGGIIGFLLHLSLIYLIVCNIKDITNIDENAIISTSIFFTLLTSNIVQDNLNYIYWFTLAMQIYTNKNKLIIRE